MSDRSKPEPEPPDADTPEDADTPDDLGSTTATDGDLATKTGPAGQSAPEQSAPQVTTKPSVPDPKPAEGPPTEEEATEAATAKEATAKEATAKEATAKEESAKTAETKPPAAGPPPGAQPPAAAAPARQPAPKPNTSPPVPSNAAAVEQERSKPPSSKPAAPTSTPSAQPPSKPVAPKQAAPKQAAPKQAAPKQAAPKQAAPKQAAPPDPADAARRRLLRALLPRATRSQLLAAVVCALLGFAVVVQARQAQVQSLASLRESDLVTVLDNVTQESARLDDQARALELTLDGLRTSSDRAPAARQAAQERLEVLGVLAGTLPATGPGIELEIADPKLAVTAVEVLETVQELRDAGAEAMQIGPVRVVASTALVDDPAGLLVDKTVVAPPYRLVAIGDPQTLSAALEIPGGVLEVLRGKGVEGVVRTPDTVRITALRSLQAPQYARPAPSAS